MANWEEHPRAGHPNGDPFELPADLAAVQADDALLDMIGAGHAPSDADDELTRVLAAWRSEVHAEPVKELVDTSTALALIRAAARQPARRRSPLFGSIAGAAAVVVIAFSSVGLVAKAAEPGDALWGVTQVLYSEYATSVENAAAVRTGLKEANKALEQGREQQAREALQRIREQLPAVGESEGRTELITELTTAQQKLDQQQQNPPPAPGPRNLPGMPDSTPPAPAGAGPDANKPDQFPAPEPQRTNTGSVGGPPDRPYNGMNPDQYFPDEARDPRTYYPYPGSGDHPRPKPEDFRYPMDGRPMMPDRPDETATNPGPDDPRSTETDPRDQTGVRSDDTPPPAPSPSPPPEQGSTVGTGLRTDESPSPSTDLPLVIGLSPEQPEVTETAEIAQPSFSTITASA